jgi:hypothetical protein
VRAKPVSANPQTIDATTVRLVKFPPFGFGRFESVLIAE